MEINALYETAKNFAGILKQNYPHFESDPDACLALIIADSGDIYSGVSSVTINEGTPEALPAENIAAMSLVTSGAKARQMIIITLEDYGFFEPNENALRILVNASPENGSCQVALSPEEASPAAALLPNAAEDFMSGYDDTDVPETTAAAPEAPAADAASLGAPAEFANGFDVDLTELSASMVYAEVYDMVYNPDDYVGKTVRARGPFSYFKDEGTGNEYFAVLISDATACCSQGIEFVLDGEYTYPKDYPAVDTEITVNGVFNYYKENGFTYCQLTNAVLEDSQLSW